MYRAIRFFTDLQDGEHPYKVGDAFPRNGLKVSENRIKELSSGNNKRGYPLIEEVAEKSGEPKEEPKKRTRKAKS